MTGSKSASDEAFQITRAVFDGICDLAFREYPLEMCGLIAGPTNVAVAEAFYPCTNIAGSAKVYTIDPTDHLKAERAADDHDWEINGVVHSHTHSEPYPSPTDVAQAPDPGWHYLIVSLKRDAPELRAYRIVDGVISETSLSIID
ncbi:MAG TPA: M67 family metallopeptidase [Ilumatobacter sp.]|nr:M67 family metallopeptidase [Ilumatobacter sp.]